VTREEKKLIRLQITRLLDRCQGCQFRSVTNASIHVCPSCPIGQRMQELGKKLSGRPEVMERQQRQKKIVMQRWTKEEEEFILVNQHRMTKMQLAQKLGWSYHSVRNKLTKLNRTRGRIHAS
jgi:ribosome-binding protein aMBF1 (putative translation factor)